MPSSSFVASIVSVTYAEYFGEVFVSGFSFEVPVGELLGLLVFLSFALEPEAAFEDEAAEDTADEDDTADKAGAEETGKVSLVPQPKRQNISKIADKIGKVIFLR